MLAVNEIPARKPPIYYGILFTYCAASIKGTVAG